MGNTVTIIPETKTVEPWTAKLSIKEIIPYKQGYLGLTKSGYLLKINKNRFGYISLSGGALIAYISGEKLPGLEVLERRGRKAAGGCVQRTAIDVLKV